MIKISNELRNKIRIDLKVVDPHIPIYLTSEYLAILYFDKEESDLLLEVQEWLRKKDVFFRSSYEAYKINCGRFSKIYPNSINLNKKFAIFYLDGFARESWKDWFVIEGESYAPK